MSILVVGSVAFDTIESPAGRAERCLGGAATHFALAASFFTPVRVIAVVGEDFTPENEAVLTRRGIDTRGIDHAAGKSFFWSGSYEGNLNEAQTRATELNVFSSFSPRIPAEYMDSEYLFLANIDPVLQAEVRGKMPDVRMVCGDTMNYWINGHAVLPPAHLHGEGRHEQMRKRKPHGAELADAGIERISQPPRDAQVRDRIAIEQHHAARKAVGKGQHRGQRGEQADEHRLLPELRLGGDLSRGARFGGRWQTVPQFRADRAAPAVRCRSARQQMNPSRRRRRARA